MRLQLLLPHSTSCALSDLSLSYGYGTSMISVQLKQRQAPCKGRSRVKAGPQWAPGSCPETVCVHGPIV